MSSFFLSWSRKNTLKNTCYFFLSFWLFFLNVGVLCSVVNNFFFFQFLVFVLFFGAVQSMNYGRYQKVNNWKTVFYEIVFCQISQGIKSVLWSGRSWKLENNFEFSGRCFKKRGNMTKKNISKIPRIQQLLRAVMRIIRDYCHISCSKNLHDKKKKSGFLFP